MGKNGEETRNLLVTELKYLRRGRGASLMRLMACPTLLDALRQPNDPLEAFREALEALGGSVQARALVHAYGLELHDPDKLTARRANFATLNNMSQDTVENYENEMIEELATILEQASAVREIHLQAPDGPDALTLFVGMMDEWMNQKLEEWNQEDESNAHLREAWKTLTEPALEAQERMARWNLSEARGDRTLEEYRDELQDLRRFVVATYKYLEAREAYKCWVHLAHARTAVLADACDAFEEMLEKIVHEEP